eukprot:gene3899-3947_t
MHYTSEHIALQDSVRQFIDKEVNPHVDEWERAGIFPAHEVFGKMGKLGYLGIHKPVEYGGLGLDYSFEIAFCEAIGHIAAQGVSMALAVQTDMATPALTQFGSDYLKRNFLAPAISGENVVSVGKIDKIGMWSSDTAQIFFDEVRVPQRNLIGEEGKGFIYQMMQFQEERLSAAARRVTALDMCINETIAYTRDRVAFGRPILDNQVVHFRLAELKTEVELLRSLVYRAADTHMAGEDMTQLASMAKLKVGRLCREVTDACLQYWGGMGFTLDNPVSRAYRDLRLISIGGGADEVMLQIICKNMGILPKRPA